MLSLVGSLQLDPFSPAHVPSATPNSKPSQPRTQPQPSELDLVEQEIDSEEEDTFGMLGRVGNDAARREADAKKADVEAKKHKEKKERKRKKEGTDAGQEGERKKKKV